ncbi:hypothetical protein HL667_11575 [Bradyrhizobium sp. 83012]|uniref:Uncharacterized protein n=1 Tax=Bradyrhizobium aeschynomenes TaxID=2734909 RepID=A0ABX2CBN2_9BRAD|nr:hypothetical protein [Bradyrhizobium aeschynomenes]NPU65636.1 hypothetical protein [Bradyrhizobium aeschynomenes]NPV23506.1 hypothetical protein [Bradyrhizobium aeschynomenes]
MERYIRAENIRRFRQLLETETDEHKRKILQQLLADEEARNLQPDPKDPSS